MRILIFGGLNAVGASITNYFLQEGVETKVVKTTPFNEAEEEQELFFGRNELYRAIDSRSELEDEDGESIDTVCFAGHLEKQKKEELFKDFETVLKGCRKVETVILLSQDFVGERGDDERADVSEEDYFQDIERRFSDQFESREKAEKCRLFILRLPKGLLSNKPFKEKKEIKKMAKAVFELAGCPHQNGVHAFRFVSNKNFGSMESGEGTPFRVEESHPLTSEDAEN